MKKRQKGERKERKDLAEGARKEPPRMRPPLRAAASPGAPAPTTNARPDQYPVPRSVPRSAPKQAPRPAPRSVPRLGSRTHVRCSQETLDTYPAGYFPSILPKSNTRNRINGTNFAQNAVSCNCVRPKQQQGAHTEREYA